MDARTSAYVFSQEHHGSMVPYIAALHASCINVDHMVGSFLPPLAHDKLLAWWRARIAEANNGTRIIMLWLPQTVGSTLPQGPDLRGLAMVKLSESETGSFRGHIDAVLVNQKFRRQGGARALISALEHEAGRLSRTLLMVNTETGSVGERAFQAFGYAEIGKVPRFSRVVSGGSEGGTFFYKDLLQNS